MRAKNTSTQSESIKFHVRMVKGKRNGLTFTEYSVKICRFLGYIDNHAITMQRNRHSLAQKRRIKTGDESAKQV